MGELDGYVRSPELKRRSSASSAGVFRRGQQVAGRFRKTGHSGTLGRSRASTGRQSAMLCVSEPIGWSSVTGGYPRAVRGTLCRSTLVIDQPYVVDQHRPRRTGRAWA